MNSAIVQSVGFIRMFDSDLGWMGFIRDSEHVIVQTKIGFPSEAALFEELRSSLIQSAGTTLGFELAPAENRSDKTLERRFKTYASGKQVEFAEFNIDLSGRTQFQSRVINQCRKIPFGQTKSYGELAQRVGAGGTARAVGTVMAQNCFPLIVPCHRVVAAGRRLGGFSAPNGVNLKRRMLLLESVEDLVA